MTSILDIHSHKRVPYPDGIVSLRINGHSDPLAAIIPDQFYSAGIHPWDIPETDLDKAYNQLEELIRHPQIVAIGECGIDLAARPDADGNNVPKGGPLFMQLQIFRQHVKLSESCGKPMILHCVKADDIICGLRRDLHPGQSWAIHGYRGKPGGANALLRAGCYLSFGENFNPGTLIGVFKDNPERLLAETDESGLTIESIISKFTDIISNAEETISCDASYLTSLIAHNSKKFCNFESLDFI